MEFPNRSAKNIAEYGRSYIDAIATAWNSVDLAALECAADALIAAFENGRRVFSCGNGGSAAIANHLVCDHSKGISTDTKLLPRVASLSSNVEIITAIANDIAFEDIFAFQLPRLASADDVLVAISSSGNSENVIRALTWAKRNNVRTIGMCGFSGGKVAELAEVVLYVKAENFGIVEDVHQGLMHVLAQYIRQKHMPAGMIPSRSF